MDEKAQSRGFFGRVSYFIDHANFLYNDNKSIFFRYLLYTAGRTITYPFRMFSFLADNSELRYRKAIAGKKEVIINILGNKMILPTADEGLSRDLIIEGIREPSSVKVLWRELRPDMNVLDLGANLGYYLLMEAKINKGGKGEIYAVEPNPAAVEYIKKNLKINNYEGIEVKNIAISDKKGTAPFYIAKSWNCSRFIAGQNTSDIVKTIQMKIETLDNLYKNKKIDFIRMDVEGYEFHILRGATKLIENNPGMAIFFEFHAQFFNTKQREEFIRFLKENRLRIKYLFKGTERNPRPYTRTYKDLRNALYTTHYLYLEAIPEKNKPQ